MQSSINTRKIEFKGLQAFAKQILRVSRYASGLLILINSEASFAGPPNWTLEKIREQGLVEKCQKAQQLYDEKLFVKAGKIMDEIHRQLSESQFDGGGARNTFALLIELDGHWKPSIGERGLVLHREKARACENNKEYRECANEYVFSYYGNGADAEALEQAAHDGNFLQEVHITRVMQLSNNCKIEPSSVFVNSVSLQHFKVSDKKFQKK